MNEPKFKVGDVVNIKGNKSINLVINEVKKTTSVGETIEQISNGFYECLWFDCTFELKYHDFQEAVLEIASSNPE